MLTDQQIQWVNLMQDWDASPESISRAIEVPVDQVIEIVGDTNLQSNGRDELKKALVKDNDELTMFWLLFRESWRKTESPLSCAYAYSYLNKMLRPNSTVTFEACVELIELVDSAFAALKTCSNCGRMMINIPFLQPYARECCRA
ncbi:hypothetical protein B9Z51_06890 [Limnohabitans sp. T6-5]|uniref:hypothetical protein n=1 Tax=Limnohabitans sp. T6-5 TaxID=1100724 RepID=UPI000D383271|nr:hypothetical protein [Limnohabitans sp. T6-5]PUE08671.1 hypothetical protein B9Z51_06890 [Limnohabitans sp. T6-5]